MSKPHPKLAKSPLKEAQFEIELADEIYASIVFDAVMQNIDKDNYKSLTNRYAVLSIDSKSDILASGESIKEQMANRDRMIVSNDQHSRFLFSKNAFSYGVRSNYKGWEDFRDALHSVLSSYTNIKDKVTYKKLSLKFLNAIPWVKRENGDLETQELRNLLRGWLVPKELPKTISKSVFQVSSNIFMESEVGVRRIEIAYPTYDDMELTYVHLEIEILVEFEEPQDFSLDEIMDWIDIAHSEIHMTFVKTLSSKYYKEIQ